MTSYAVFEDSHSGAPPRVSVIMSDDDGRNWHPFGPVFPGGQREEAEMIAEAMNARAASQELRELQLRFDS